MKIAFIVGNFPVLSYTPILNQITGLIKMGHEVDIFSFARGETEKIHPEIQKYGLMERVMYLDPLSWVSDRIRNTRLALDEKFSKKLGFKLPSFELFRKVRDIVLILILIRSSRLSKKGNYDIIHCQMGTVGLRFLPLYKLRILSGKLVVQFRGEDITEYTEKNGNGVYVKLFQEADYFLPVCDYLRNRAIELGCPVGKIGVMRSAIDLECFVYSKRRKPKIGPVKVVFVGRLVEKKGIEYAIRAVSILKQKGYKMEFLIVGDGPLKKKLEGLCQDLNIKENVKFFGAKNRNEVLEILNKSHMFVAPSVTAKSGNEEGIPNVLKEAMAVGLPIVSTYHAGIPELIENGVSGYLVPERDPRAIAERLAYLMEHPEVWNKIGKLGRRFVERNYDKEKLNKELISVYKNLIN